MSDLPVTNQTQALNYMNNERLWAAIIVEAWKNPVLSAEIVALATSGSSANAFLSKMATQLDIPVTFQPDGVQTIIVVDDPTRVHLIFPPVENIPPNPVQMVPHAL